MQEKKRVRRMQRYSGKMDVMATIANEDNSDVDGSYTGTSADGGEPVQDGDDI